MPEYSPDYVPSLIFIETNVNDAFIVFSIFKSIFRCLADLRADPRTETIAELYTRLCAEPNFT